MFQGTHLPSSCQGVPDGQGEGDRSSQSGEEEHVLQVVADLVLPAQVQEEGQRVNVQGTTEDDRHEGGEDEAWRTKQQMKFCGRIRNYLQKKHFWRWPRFNHCLDGVSELR